VPKQRTRRSSKESPERRGGRPSLDNGQGDNGAQVREKRGDTPIDTLRRTYGDSFAPGIRGDAHLKTLLDRTGSASLSDYLKSAGRSPVNGDDTEDRVTEKPANILYASSERFREAHRKTSALHAGLYRRLAE
jgi:hypothetical protein